MRRGGFIKERNRRGVASMMIRKGDKIAMGNVNEIGFSICRAPDDMLVSGPVAVGTPNRVNIPIACPPDAEFIGLFHTHPGGVAKPSQLDEQSAADHNAKVMCIEADGILRCFPVDASLKKT